MVISAKLLMGRLATRVLWISLSLVVVSLAATEKGVTLLRTFRNAALVEISPDGQLILARLDRRRGTDCPNRKPYCFSEVLAVYDAKIGKSVGELVTKGDGYFFAVGFVRDHRVSAIEEAVGAAPTRVDWDPVSGSTSRTELPAQKDAHFFCATDDTQMIRGVIDRSTQPWLYQLQTVNATGAVRKLQQPSIPFLHNGTTNSVVSRNCATRRSRDLYLVEGTSAIEGLYWVSIHPDAQPLFCHSFEGERIRNYTISRDGSLIAVATDAREAASEVGKLHPDHPIFLTLLNADGCSVLQRFELRFPEKQTLKSPPLGSYEYYDNSHFGAQFPAEMAIAPDKTMLAVAYGVYRSPSGYAYFGLYSLADGHRLATLNGDVLHKWLWSGFLNDEIRAQSAPINGALQFSQDSRSLYGSSEHLRQWDISGLK